jgi:hypothetical protein
MAQVTYPSYDALPRLEGTSQGCAWGIFDKDNRKDVFGCLNKVTPDTVKEASKEIRDGVSISLKYYRAATHSACLLSFHAQG